LLNDLDDIYGVMYCYNCNRIVQTEFLLQAEPQIMGPHESEGDNLFFVDVGLRFGSILQHT